MLYIVQCYMLMFVDEQVDYWGFGRADLANLVWVSRPQSSDTIVKILVISQTYKY